MRRIRNACASARSEPRAASWEFTTCNENRGKSVGESVVSGGAFGDAARVTRVPEGPPIPFDLDGIGVTVIAHGAAFHRTRGALPVPRASRPSP